MQSSSRLFPVVLSSAEIRADLSEDVYLLRHGRASDSSVELALTRLGRADAGKPGVPVILLHGSFSNRRFWYSPRGIGPGAFLARAGFDVWIAEMRGHGLSPRNQRYRHNQVRDYAAEDLPAIADFVIEQNGCIPHWVGHSLGGTVLAAAFGGGFLDAQRGASLALFGSQVSRLYWPLKIPPLEWALRLVLGRFNYLSGSRFKRGPEDEPMGVVLESLRWHRLFGRFGDRTQDWGAGLREVAVPLFAVAGAGDRQDPPAQCYKLFEQFGSAQRTWLCLGRDAGFSCDFGHVDMLVSRAAEQEVWPLLAQWLNSVTVNVARDERLTVSG
ncbi:alpha/beta fold hydrolase [Pseudomonas mangrovi]|jgi:predicted alpha/beta hydrolase|uniref:Alpha/beta hydrolase n=1 Tax=Pseudomonas mangrovi TaxID=2161748 RepID=A0A2T5P7C1_9PSED|nr:alpha/beta fold hydrolase [Pseudomonas mangrovi]PTU73659.1 alpha/beta hydrolase [Pseudomonas mangrovi]